ncbi:MAG TPA: hypothetical protein VGZ29_13775 [Terriglobia bacterium]|nr:hypothetical protein [Terriglobia bacterium]
MPDLGPTAQTEFTKWALKQRREKVEITVATRLSLSRYRTLESWCQRSLRRRAELVGIVLNRVLELYEEEGAAEPLEFFVRRLHLRRDL